MPHYSLHLPIQVELSLPVNQVLALFIKVVRKITKHLQEIQKAAIEATVPDIRTSKPAAVMRPLAQTVDEELAEAGKEAKKQLANQELDIDDEMRARQREMIDRLDLSK